MSGLALADDGGARHLRPGLPLPDIELASTRGGTVSPARLAGRAVLYVYPWTGRPGMPDPPDWDHIPGAHGSTPEAQGFRDHHDAFKDLGIAIYGISGQETDYQLEFSNRLGLPFALLSDAHFAFCDALSLPTFTTGGVRYLKRLTLIIVDGAIERTHYPVHPPASHAEDVIAALGPQQL